MTEILYRSAVVDRITGRTLYGILCPFNVRARVADSVGPTYTEQFVPGSFSRTIRERGSKIRLFANHDLRRFPIGSAIHLEEDSGGLRGSFLIASTRDGDDALELVRAGLVNGFSVGFTAQRQRREADGTVTRTEVALREVSLVHSPAYETALVAGVRSDIPIPRLSTALARQRLIEATIGVTPDAHRR